VLGRFCGKRDIPSLRKEELKKKYGIDQADVMVLFWWKHPLWWRSFSKRN